MFFFETDSDGGLVPVYAGAVCASRYHMELSSNRTQHHVTSKVIYGHYNHIVMYTWQMDREESPLLAFLCHQT
jgi:hypothetical protein